MNEWKKDLEVAQSLIGSWSTTPIRTGIWNCWFLRRGKTGQPEEKPLGAKEQQQIQTPLLSLPPPTNYNPIYLLTKKMLDFTSLSSLYWNEFHLFCHLEAS